MSIIDAKALVCSVAAGTLDVVEIAILLDGHLRGTGEISA